MIDSDEKGNASPRSHYSLKATRVIAFETDEGTGMNVDVSPDGKEIVFDLLGDLYTLPITGGKATRLLGGRDWDSEPQYSPDGRSIAFISDRGGESELWIVDRRGDQPTRLIAAHPVIDRASPESATWSIDGRELLVVFGLCCGSSPYGASFEREGIRIQPWTQFVSLAPDNRHAYLGEWKEITRVDRVTGESVTLTDTNEKVAELMPRVSRSGRWLAYLHHDDEEGRTSLWLRELRTGDKRKLIDLREGPGPGTGDDYYRFRFSFMPDDSAIVLWKEGKLWRVSVTDGAVSPIPFRASVEQQIVPPVQPRARHFNDGPMPIRGIRTPALSADGKTLVFTAVGKLWVETPGAGTPRRLTASHDRESDPALSPDAKWVAYLKYPERTSGESPRAATRAHVTVVPLSTAGSAERVLAAEAALYGAPTWTPDGSTLVFACPDARTDDANEAPNRSFCRLDVRKPGARPEIIGPEPRRNARHENDPLRLAVDRERLYYFEEEEAWIPNTTRADFAAHLMSIALDGSDVHRHLTIMDGIEVAAIAPGGRQVLVGPRIGSGAFLVNVPSRAEPPARVALTDAEVRQVTKRPITYAYWPTANTVIFGFGPEMHRLDINDSAPRPFHTVNLSLPRHRPQGVFAIQGARIITATPDGAPALERGTLVVRNGRIETLGAADQIQVPPDAKVIDGAGLTLMPGLIDVHFHYSDRARLRPLRNHPSSLASLAYGVTTIYDPSIAYNALDEELERAEMIEAGIAVGPRHFYSGRSIGYDYNISSLAAARQAAATLAGNGAVVLKDYLQPTRQRREWLVRAASESGVGITSHHNQTLRDTLTLFEDGFTATEHANFFLPGYRDVVMLMAQSGVSFTPTLSRVRGLPAGRLPFYREMLRDSPGDIRKLFQFFPPKHTKHMYSYIGLTADGALPERAVIPDAEVNLSRRLAADVLRAGGIVSVGAHEGVGLFTHWEMRAIADGGASPLEVIRAATLNGAKKLGIESEVGTLETGKLADFIVLTANPIENIKNTTRIKYVVANGVIYDDETMTPVWPN